MMNCPRYAIALVRQVAPSRLGQRSLLLAALLTTLLSPPILAESEHGKGFIPEAPEKYAAMPQAPRYRDYLAPKADLSALFPKPGNQGRQGSCVAWATAYAARTYHEASRQGSRPSVPENIFSPAFVYNQVKSRGCEDGSSISSALELMKQTGVASLAQFPYDAYSCSRLPNSELVSDAARFRIDGWQKVDINTLDDIKSQIYAGNPVIFGMEAPDSFEKLGKHQIYDDRVSTANGGHAMVLVGYDESKQAFKLINSWGEKWGDDGFGWISYRALQARIRNAYVMQLTKAAPKPQPVEAPPSPLPEVVGPTPTPTPTPIPKPKVKPVPIVDLHGKVAQLVATANCADLKGVVNANGRVTLSGFVGHAEDLTRIQTELTAWGVGVEQHVQLYPWPQCEALLTFHDVLQKTSGLRLSVTGGQPAVLKEGDTLHINVTTPDYPSYLYLAYVQANGDVVQLIYPQGRLPKPLPPNTQLVLGDGAGGKPKFTIKAPFGDEMIVAITAASPLFAEDLPKSQVERDYLTQFRLAFLEKPEPGAADRVINAAITTLVTQAKP